MIRPVGLPLASLLLGLFAGPASCQHVSAQSPAGPVVRRMSAVPGYIFPKEPAYSAQGLRPTAHPGTNQSVLRLEPFQLDGPSPYANRPPAGPIDRRGFQNA